ncbi:MAG: CHAT domain-containing protein [Xenococcaceae cyanobacterium]
MFKLGIPKVDAALDWVWLVDFGQGNLALAQAEASAALLDRENTSTLLARGVVHQLQGEYNQALSLFEAAFIATTNDQQKYTCAAVAHYAEIQAREILPDGCLVMVNGNQKESLWKRRFNQLKSYLESEVASQISAREDNDGENFDSAIAASLFIEGDFLKFVSTDIPTWRTILGRWGDRSHKEEYLVEIEQKFTCRLESYQNLDIFKISKNLYSVLAELLALTGKIEAGWDILDNLVKAHKQHGQYLETGWYLLCQGDLLISLPSLGKPIVFGYHLHRLDTSWAEKSPEQSASDFATAQQLYWKARQYFDLAKASRGEGMAILRLAYLNAINQQWNLAHYGYEEAIACFEAVGDRLNAIAAEMGKLWSYLHYRDLDEKILVRVSKLALNTRENGAIAQGVGWGLTFALAAQEALRQKQDAEVALNLARIAETILSVFTEERELLSWQLFQQILLHYDSVMQDVYTHLTELFIQKSKPSEAFVLAEMANIYNIRKVLGAVSQQNITALEIEQIPAYLPPNTLVISYLLTETTLLAWAINSEGEIKYTRVNKLGKRPFLATKLLVTAQNWLNCLAREEFNQTIGKILESTFLSYFDREIAQAKHLVIIPCRKLSIFPFDTLLWRTQLLGEQKSLSYLSAVSQLADFQYFQPTLIARKAVFIAYGEALWQQQFSINRFSSLKFPSILEGVAKMMADLYETQVFMGDRVSQDDIFACLTPQPKIIHLFVEKVTFSNLDLSQLNLKDSIVILTLANLKLAQLDSKQLTGIAQSLIYTGAKTVLLNCDPLYQLKAVAASMLLLYFHLGLCSGYTVGGSLHQAQQQLELVTVAEALNFCHIIQNCIPWHQDSDRANRALLTKYMGDLLFLGQDYVRAVEAYEVARNIFYSVGYFQQARSFEQEYQQTITLAKLPHEFSPQKLIFDSPAWKGMYRIVGDWQQVYCYGE